jgi:hypothetical protein
MYRMNIRFILTVMIAGCVSLAAQTPTARFVSHLYPGGEAQGDQRWVCIRVIDGQRGTPIPRAELLLIDESSAPIGGAPIVAWRGQANEQGFISMRVDKAADGYQSWGWLCVRADGYCQHMRMGGFDDEVISLMPTITVPVQVRDWRDQPVAGALVGFCAGCGHTPDLVHGVTNAKGTVTLPGIDISQGITDFYVVHQDLKLGYDNPPWFPGTQPMLMRVASGVPHTGVVVDHAGKPVTGVAVGLSTVHRGPWTLTRADGSFALFGLDSVCDLHVQHAGRTVIFECDTADGLQLQLPKPNGEETQLVYFSPQERKRKREAQEERQKLLDQIKAKRPTVEVRIADLPDDGSLALRTRLSNQPLDLSWDDNDVARVKTVALPDEEFVFEIQAEDSVRVIPGDREQAVKDGRVSLQWFAKTKVTGRIVNASGEACAATVSIKTLRSPDDEPLAKVTCNGTLLLSVAHEGHHQLIIERSGMAVSRTLLMELPARGDDVSVDIGTIVLPDESPFTITNSDGSRFKDGFVTLLRDGFVAWEQEFEDAEKIWAPDLRSGDCLLVEGEQPQPADLGEMELVELPCRFLVNGKGPWSFQRHAGELALNIEAGGQLIGVTIGEHFVAVNEPTLIRGLAPGRHQAFVSAEGHRSAIVDIQIPDTGRARINLKLPTNKR